ncbi:MAG TPA: hypothetical protein IAA00_04160 [Candidatus Blautia ornithocaccae]|uniref:hypothetical protein n=1 Tax=Blautia sp. An81 TaxID=1965659 RepID=UPI001303F559|nr:hypothetical protein [Blautia sp. An81]HJD36113.1 hypothetical protein [Candidatus Blautia ornithocaccae]
MEDSERRKKRQQDREIQRREMERREREKLPKCSTMLESFMGKKQTLSCVL